MARAFLETDTNRLSSRLVALTGLDRRDVSHLIEGQMDIINNLPRAKKRAVADLVDPATEQGAHLESIIGVSAEFVPASFLTSARAAANTVARIVTRQRRAVGTGVLVSDQLVMTNHHVAASVEVATGLVLQFDYELGADGVALPAHEFELAPEKFFWTSPENELDTSIVAVGDLLSGSAELRTFGHVTLSSSTARHAVGDHVTIIEHPNGDYKQVALRGNRVLGVGASGVTLHYTADTLPGSSGSPVFNDQFEIVALHHAGGHELESTYKNGKAIPDKSNEGIRISSIVAAVSAAGLPPEYAALINTGG